ncbi:bifunctional phosphopantothenoylcysteine decarboxylase/phosphopantothenate--cysteine ligase CoaBC [Halanaerobium sp. Z-7514]|uniref:Coenzyme A biosynthesis bifunctional protein CoaBC n=1 Tax=Halanaerobium polyolivorans TaxID=2886943 RepID=A0AAW4WXR6_9FIRM|nr:bifunctional phosphopantothenoylcysteine decarboxylase/phosphopantothenate--cysteine ligase CoaBC [Halanaerobium polyolivorans]MCC3144768.1 bifunctional phosphopantothenoylcysteine decarboxylase/phosphopantothenate--cysteine ligase CoaBC [Halanaerobium polyolivorans]
MSANITLGVTGGIAAYKMLSVASKLTKLNYNVYTVMTEAATKFVSPLAFHSITHLDVETELFSSWSSNEVKHIELADKSELFLLAPATANFIAKAAAGIADDLLTTVILARQAPILIAPSMNVHMFENEVVQRNLNNLEELGFKIITPGEGYLACGYTGKGRLPEPDILVEHVEKELTKKDLQDKKILISAGPTREAIDPVRFLSNYSSGKMGYALAKAASYRGADVSLVSGPTQLQTPLGVNKIEVETASEMETAILKEFKEADITIMAAAVADYTPKNYNKEKLKKRDAELKLELKRTTDILKELGAKKRKDQLLVGFAAESEDLIKNARKKLASKKADYIIANDISDKNIAFASDKNKITILSQNSSQAMPLENKEDLAHKIFDYLI